MIYDLIVVGGGPAGMTAALYALRNGKTALIIEKNVMGGQITFSPKVENYPGTMQMSGNEFADRFLDQVMAQGGEIELAEVTGIEDRGEIKAVKTDFGDSFEGRTVVLATGVKHRMLGLENEENFIGGGISFCAVCDGDFFTGRSVIVAGGGNSALQEAILLADKCSKVTVLQDLPFFTGETKLQEVLFARPNVEKHTGMKITGILSKDGVFAGVTALDKETGVALSFEADGMFEAVGLIPENEAFADLAELDGFGYFESGESCLTKTPGVFVAGDCRAKSIRQLTTAASDGAVAAMAACRYINGA